MEPLVKIGKRRDKDPTLTRPVRDRYAAEAARRFRALIPAIRKYVVEDNRLGARLIRDAGSAIINVESEYVYEDSAVRLAAFIEWLDQQVREGVLHYTREPAYIPYGHTSWQDVFIYSAYQRGVAQALADLSAAGAAVPEGLSVSAAMLRPFHADRVALLYTRAFNGMKGVTEAMKAQMADVLAKGMADGVNPFQIARRLSDRVNKIGITRAKLLARTETTRAHVQATLNEYAALEGVVGERIDVQWWTANDERVRGRPGGKYPNAIPSHWAWHGKIYTKEQAQTMIGAPNCLLGTAMTYCPGRIEGAFERLYDGPVVVLHCSSGNRLACTPNHPVATTFGLVPAGLLQDGDNLICCCATDLAVSVGKDENEAHPCLQDVARSFSLSHVVSGVPLSYSASYFHGDGVGSEVAIVRSNLELRDCVNSAFQKELREFGLSLVGVEDSYGSSFGPFLFDLIRILLSSALPVRSFDLVRSHLRRHVFPFNNFGLAFGSETNSASLKEATDCCSTSSERFGQRVYRFPSIVALDNIVSVSYEHFSGHVYNLQTEDGFFLAVDNKADFVGKVNYYITGNCRCTVLPYSKTLAEARAEFSRK